ncbi:DNA polymerase-3 subunit epsilon [Actimicrobium sp. GrIS 1.19]|uniref:3'-5' exonuclease family protein n=1 Tax=Actimicrobium sp. GrIS 1.19 TaxID=3071708 RepID=UPI002DF84BDD|nr:DNA polymerase-3 subunit epsilon [Actimicrobium sp. GrIS 1.19]
MNFDPLHPRLAFVDLETTGATATSDRITEVGIVEVDEDGVREWSSLVNPHCRIPEFIEGLTGISNAMVADAPSFEDLAAEIHARLEGRIFLAHNARFDHGFLKNEFRRLGIDFRPTVLCTVKLSRKLYPGFAKHNLDTLAERHRLQVTERHRALGDAKLIWQFWQVIHATLPHEQIHAAVKELTTLPSLPSNLDAALIDDLPTTHGVYLFYDDSQLPLYVGKANNLRRRVLSHFSGDHTSSKELQLSQQIRRVEWIETAGELGALLKEAALIKQLMPTHNHQLRRNEETCAWRLVQHGEQWKLALVNTEDLFFGDEEHLFGPYASTRKATTALKAIADAHQLCHALLGLEKVRSGKACFASQVMQCPGACVGRETAQSHTARMFAALESERMQRWPYAGPVGIREGAALHIVNNWSYYGTAGDEAAAWELIEHGQARFDRDVYKILHKKLAAFGTQVRRFF